MNELIKFPKPKKKKHFRLDPADTAFSQWIRLRDKQCMRCYSPVEFKSSGLPKSHECSHYFGRTKESVRFDPENCDTLCHGCHRFWEKEDREAYREFKIKQLGQEGYARLCIRARTTVKRDRKMQRIIWREAVRQHEDTNL